MTEITNEMIERACRAYDDDWYEDKDHTVDGDATWLLMERVLTAALHWQDSQQEENK